MASVKKFPGSSHWYACYRIPTGQRDANGKPVFKRVQRSTGLEDKGSALQIAISNERAADLVVEQRWTEQTAHKLVAELSIIGGVEVGQVEQTEKFLKRWLAAKRKSVAEKTAKNFEGIVNDFLEWLGARKAAPLLDITPRVVAEFRDAERASGKSGTTVNKALSVLCQAFEEAVNQLALQKNPVRGLRFKKADKNAQERKHFAFEVFRELVRRTGSGEKSKRGREVHPDWQTFIIATGYTGGRQQEIAQLEWANVDLTAKVIGLRRTKNDDVHYMPMHPALHSHLSSLAAEKSSDALGEYVLSHLSGMKERKLSKIFRETILPRVGISQPYAKRSEEKGVGRKLAEYSIHSLRHSLATWLRAAGVEEMMRMRLVGHEDEKVSRNYTHTEMTQAAHELEKVPAL